MAARLLTANVEKRRDKEAEKSAQVSENLSHFDLAPIPVES